MKQAPLLFYNDGQILDYIVLNWERLNTLASKRNMKIHIENKHKKMYFKDLDERLIELAYYAAEYVMCSANKTFKVTEALKPLEKTKSVKEVHNAISDFQKLGYWGIFKNVKGSRWKLTPIGIGFLTGMTELPRRVGVLDNKVVEESEEMVTVENAKARWQTAKSDYVLDSKLVKV